ncbi:ABC transporter permease, partial [Bifidobacterium animalis]|nr:ABC transporter permease [Bifidobacterium animalis]
DKQRFLFNLPHWQVRIDNASWLMMLGIIIASSIASIIPAFRITRLTPAMILDTNTMRGVGTMRSTPRNPRRDSQQHWQ